jgi:hypothetical protein
VGAPTGGCHKLLATAFCRRVVAWYFIEPPSRHDEGWIVLLLGLPLAVVMLAFFLWVPLKARSVQASLAASAVVFS